MNAKTVSEWDLQGRVGVVVERKDFGFRESTHRAKCRCYSHLSGRRDDDTSNLYIFFFWFFGPAFSLWKGRTVRFGGGFVDVGEGQVGRRKPPPCFLPNSTVPVVHCEDKPLVSLKKDFSRRSNKR
ncbi:acetyltransferase [Anopheles sinensis]|uniref:Acetyltransferase n=1 Tax=Anopheles sinensis TaxID=74873 RepID=A0A084VRR4_ANOSI|nr:acetyltransferase [Anopheles sinensis]